MAGSSNAWRQRPSACLSSQRAERTWRNKISQARKNLLSHNDDGITISGRPLDEASSGGKLLFEIDGITSVGRTEPISLKGPVPRA
uniref:AlNc14C201G8705 protein n=1 Tax=Albugo laibachii Nc14 TaxID=890382 RepID=F0WQP5_9STRA|nr:AlNc14C201G8705 [Albugo laibachii Nc14]|eukprot:CCA23654.1 AlNc14C201G8705 [Albugo laibachii Nc14]